MRASGKTPPSPRVLERVREIEALAHRLMDPAPIALRVVGKVVELVATRQAQNNDRLERPPVVSDPGARWSFYNQGWGAPKRRVACGRADKGTLSAGGTKTSWPLARRRVERPADPGGVRVEHEDDEHQGEDESAKKKRLAVVG